MNHPRQRNLRLISEKSRKSAGGFPVFLNIDIAENLSFHRCLYLKKHIPISLFRSALFSIAGIDKNAQNRRISVSSPYKRTAETDFGERKSEYNKTQEIRMRISCLPFNRYY